MTLPVAEPAKRRRNDGRIINFSSSLGGPTATDLFLAGKPPELVERMSKMAPRVRSRSAR